MRQSVVIAAVVALGCANPLGPHSRLLGSWSDGQTAFTATLAGATLRMPCVTATFAPIQLDDSSRFDATGTVSQAVGLVMLHVGDPFPLRGQLIGDRLAIGTDTLTPGAAYQHVCNA